MVKVKLIVLGIIFLSLFYLAVLYLSLNPHVSIAYSEYYIHNKTMFYDKKVPDMLIPLGKTLTVKNLMPYFSRDGWSKPSLKTENALLFNKASLIFNIKGKSEIMTLYLQLSQIKQPVTLLFSIAGNRFEKLLFPRDKGLIILNVSNALSHQVDGVNILTISASSPISLKTLMVKES
ncbi:hypothetical protein [uncultured Shewanella sp.]|uniref:hypothetical protein n=1 Tax=uncultured Shewanella sp. TaxID=173975 RepID=UPI0026066C4F|nr:hypothetical protein [uncultured Shewanella sp.]